MTSEKTSLATKAHLEPATRAAHSVHHSAMAQSYNLYLSWASSTITIPNEDQTLCQLHLGPEHTHNHRQWLHPRPSTPDRWRGGRHLTLLPMPRTNTPTMAPPLPHPPTRHRPPRRQNTRRRLARHQRQPLEMSSSALSTASSRPSGCAV